MIKYVIKDYIIYTYEYIYIYKYTLKDYLVEFRDDNYCT